MHEYRRRLIVHLGFEATVGAVSRALREEGLQIVGRIDIRDQIRQDLRRDFRRYVLLEAWSPEFAVEMLDRNPDWGPMFPTVFAIYELGVGETVVVTTGMRRKRLGITHVLDQEITRIGEVFRRLERLTPRRAEPSAA